MNKKNVRTISSLAQQILQSAEPMQFLFVCHPSSENFHSTVCTYVLMMDGSIDEFMDQGLD